ncbi:hypothetical protein AX16_000487 [Volvariella volvacea WC 439]|nr:hypothetical protein AX16_000487 [Volvariella volvacea WC 439]
MTGTSRSSSHYSPASATASLPPSWAPPNAPLPPHRLAKLANALGIATPIPVVHTVPTISAPPSEGRQTPTDPLRRSPTPFASSNSSVTAYTTATSKYLLHVIPPLHLPHDLDPSGPFELTPAPPNASGYHPQFRRGVLVPFHSNFQSQLGAIAKEYALPSTTGMILYLVNSRPTNIQSRSPTPAPEDVKDAEGDEPGPRLSEDIWKHLWTRVVRSEPRDDTLLLPSRSPTPNFALNASQEPPDQPPLRPFISTSGLDVHRSGPITPTTPSTATTSEDRSHSRALFSSSGSLASDPDTPETSSISSTSLLNDRAAKRADSLELPGLHSLSSIPILAKVEFDIDRRRAGWYEAWMRSRRVNHAKRAESRQGRGDLEGDEKVEEQKRALIGLLTGTKESANFISLLSQPDASKSEGNVAELSQAEGYEPLPEPQENDDSDDGDAGEQVPNTEDLTARNLFGGRDPLEDVFGTDAETWEEMRSSRPRDSKPNNSNPHIVNLALTGAELTSEQDPQRLGDNEFEGDIDESKEADEVKDLLERMSRPRVSVSIPTSPPQTSSPGLTQGSSKKHVPPPLILQPMSASNFNDLVVPAEPSPNPSTPGSTGLPYLHSPSPREKEDDEVHYSRENILRDGGGSLDDFNQTRSPEESEKRVGTVFEELDLGSQYESSEEASSSSLDKVLSN